MALSVTPIKRYLPKSLFWRAFLILVLPILALQGVVTYVFVQRHYDGVTTQMTASVAQEIMEAIAAVERAESPAAAAERLARLHRPRSLELALDTERSVVSAERRTWTDLTGSVIAETLRARIGRPMTLDFIDVRKRVLLRIATARGALVVAVPRGRMNASNPHLLLVWMAVTSLGLTAVATLFLRNQVRPIRELAVVAQEFGRGRTTPFRPSGAEEVRRAGHAFIDMRTRIERQIGQRTLLLSGVSHDLRTPLTRMKLALAVADPCPELDEMGRDVREMERMIAVFLDFVRGESTEEPVETDPGELIGEIAAEAARQGRKVEIDLHVETPNETKLLLRASAMKRCLTNLVDNALRYGRRVRLSAKLMRRALVLTVEDDGPGIPPEHREDMLRPFARLDESRNRDANRDDSASGGSGVGLGLSIALDIARSHGGALTLDESPLLGGLRATVSLPR